MENIEVIKNLEKTLRSFGLSDEGLERAKKGEYLSAKLIKLVWGWKNDEFSFHKVKNGVTLEQINRVRDMALAYHENECEFFDELLKACDFASDNASFGEIRIDFDHCMDDELNKLRGELDTFIDNEDGVKINCYSFSKRAIQYAKDGKDKKGLIESEYARANK